MSDVLQRLRDDHAIVSRLLAMLERQTTALEQGERPDWDIIEGVVEYLLSYPDLRHHPLENKMLGVLRLKDPSAAEPFSELESEHREQSETLRRIAAATRLVLQDVSMARPAYIDLLRSFVAAQRNHARREEASFFPATERIFDAGDWSDINRQMSGIVDPLSANQTEQRFAALRAALCSWDIADRSPRAMD